MTSQTNNHKSKTTEVLTMNTEQDSKKAAKIELSREEKKALRRASMSEHGRLTLADEFKEKGFRYRVCNVLPGNIENWKSKGYEVVDHTLKSGSGRTDQPEVNGIPTEVEVGGAKGSMKGVWMRIREEDAQILDEIRDEDAVAQQNMIKESPIPKGNRLDEVYAHPTVGKVTKEF